MGNVLDEKSKIRDNVQSLGYTNNHIKLTPRKISKAGIYHRYVFAAFLEFILPNFVGSNLWV